MLDTIAYKPRITSHAVDRFAERCLKIKEPIRGETTRWIRHLIRECLGMQVKNDCHIKFKDYDNIVGIVVNRSLVTIIYEDPNDLESLED